MNTLITVAVFAAFVVFVSAVPAYDIIQDTEGQQYYLIPAARQRRQAKTEVGVFGPDLTAGVKHGGIIAENENHQLGGQVSLTKQFIPDSPITATGELGYLHKDSGSGLGATVRHAQHGSTDVGIEGKYNLYQNGNLGVDLTGGWQRSYGGPRGTSDPSWNTMLRGHYDF